MAPRATRYENAWLASQSQTYSDKDRFTVETPPDPGHGDKSELPNAVVMQDAPVLQSGGEISTDILWEAYKHLPASTIIDDTPVTGNGTSEQRGHGYGGLTAPFSSNEPASADPTRTPGYGRGFLGLMRARAMGAARRATRQNPKYLFFNENWFTARTEGLRNIPIQAGPADVVLRRGINGYPENDGDGGRIRGNDSHSWKVEDPSWKIGQYFSTNVQRDFTPPNRTHGEVKMVHPNIVTIIGDAPPPDRSDKYANPFSSLQKFLPKRRKISGLRRVPGQWDEDIVANASTPTDYMGVDGMVVP